VDVEFLRTFAQSDFVRYLVFGFETAASGTPHLQGYLVFKSPTKKSLFWLKKNFLDRAHYDVAKGSHAQASAYCKKGEQPHEEWEAQKTSGPNYGKGAVFEEFGSLPSKGERSDIKSAIKWISEYCNKYSYPPNEREMALAIPEQFFKYRKNCIAHAQDICPTPKLVEGTLNSWQATLYDELLREPSDRSILFYVDSEGSVGKTWFIKYMLTKHADRVQVLGLAKRDDMAHMVDASKDIFLINVPRGSMDYLQYSILESLKDRIVSSPKYESRVKILRRTPHVVVFSNEDPDRSKLSTDRYIVRDDF